MENTILKIEETDLGITMICDGDFTVTHAEFIKKELLDSAARKGDEILSLSNAKSIDVSGIQLAYSWKKILEAQGRQATVLLPQSENIKDLLEKTGLTKLFKS